MWLQLGLCFAWIALPSVARETERQRVETRRETQVALTVDGRPAAVGTYAFPDRHRYVLRNGDFFTATFDRDDLVYTGWPRTPGEANLSISLVSLVVNGTELAHNLNGETQHPPHYAHGDPDRQHSFYVDSGGGTARLVCTAVQVVRLTNELVEIAFLDTTSSPLQHEHHLIVRRGVPGIYGFDILTAVAATEISEVRMNARFDRGVLDHCYNDERGVGQQPTYAYLEACTDETPSCKVGDETFILNGSNAPNLPWPESNSGNYPAGYVYSKYEWSLYHAEQTIWGHFGHGRGAFMVPLSGQTGNTSTASYGIGPQHQDLAIHQDALILNYFSPNHYGVPAFPLPRGYRRLYGPWLTLLVAGATNDLVLNSARQLARREIAASLDGLPFIEHPMYPRVADRSIVIGRIKVRDGRSASGAYALLTPKTWGATDPYHLREATWWAKANESGHFEVRGIPHGDGYSLFVFSSQGSITDTLIKHGVRVGEDVVTADGTSIADLGVVEWVPFDHGWQQLWRIGEADREGSEFRLGDAPRSYTLPAEVPANVSFLVGRSDPATDWWYAQTKPGKWAVHFNSSGGLAGRAHLIVSSSFQAGATPIAALNGHRMLGELPVGESSTLSRQAVRSGDAQMARLSIPAWHIRAGENVLTLTIAESGDASGRRALDEAPPLPGPQVPHSGIGWDVVVFAVDN